jgi:perosamine synthetase
VISYGAQCIDDDDISAVVAVLKGDWLTQGPAVEEFEANLCEVTDARYAVAFSNGTAALHGAAAAAGLGPGDTVLTSPLTFMASANCARFVGAHPALVDIDPTTLNIDLTRVPKDAAAVVAVHYAGLPLDLSDLRHRPRVVIEDAAHALGARTPDGPVGNCARSDMCAFSFHPVKPITTAEGGAVTTNDSELADRLRRFRTHGIVRRPEQGGWYYEIDSLGFNYRLTDVQCALGTSQLHKLERFLARRHQIADRYRLDLADLPVTLPPAARDGFRHAYHLFAIQVDDRRRIFDGLRAAGIGVQVHYVPVHMHPISSDIGASEGDFPFAESAYSRLISLPMHPRLTHEEQSFVIETLRGLL